MVTLLIVRLLILALLMPGPALAEWLTASWDVMGTRASVELWQQDQEGVAAIELVKQEFQRLNQLLSPWIETSELARVNALAGQQPVTVSTEFYQLLETSRQYSVVTDGAFDITFASAGHLYDFRAGIEPDADALQAAVASISPEAAPALT